MKKLATFLLLILFVYSNSAFAQEAEKIMDKTMVVWVSPDNLSQKGGSALTIDDRRGRFDGIVFGEIESGKWMAGSDGFRRTRKQQDAWASETAKSGEFVQMAIIYRANNISIFRNGSLYASYKVETQQDFDSDNCVVMFGRRHLDAGDKSNSFTGRIRDARIYDIALEPSAFKTA